VTGDARRVDASAATSASFDDRVAWVCGGALLALTAVLAALVEDGASPVDRLLYTAAPLAILTITLVWAARRGTLLAVAAMCLAVTPAVLAAMAGADPAGAVAALAVSAAVVVVRFGERSASGVVALVLAVVALLGWAAATTERDVPRPSWSEVVAQTGTLLRDSVGRLDATTIVPTTGWLAWWVAAGLIAGVAVVSGDVVAAMTIPVAAALMVLVSWVLSRWRGDIHVSETMWILAAAVAFSAASVDAEGSFARRVGAAVLILVGFIWALAIVHLVRT
jgi:hypothetical protein